MTADGLHSPRLILPIAVHAVLGLGSLVGRPAALAAQALPSPLVREVAEVTVGSLVETWRLEWLKPPEPYCSVEDSGWYTCPCEGFGFGEKGPLVLVRRLADGTEERLSLDPLFDWPDAGRTSILRRWDPEPNDHDFIAKGEDQLLRRLQDRTSARIMQFADFNHDGWAAEFLVPVEPLGCGHPYSVVVGIASSNPHLHVFTTAERPTSKLVLPNAAWLALRQGPGPTRVTDWRCGNYGQTQELEIEVKTDRGRIHATRRTYACTGSSKRGRLVDNNVL
jgi:hypothetical protein